MVEDLEAFEDLIGAVGLVVGLGEFGPEGLCTVTRGEWGPV